MPISETESAYKPIIYGQQTPIGSGQKEPSITAYGKDSTGKRYDLEIQRADKGAGAHRARYHSSVMDVENLNASITFFK